MAILVIFTSVVLGSQSCSQATCPANERYTKHKKMARINHRRKKTQRGLWPKKMQVKKTVPKTQPEPNGDL